MLEEILAEERVQFRESGRHDEGGKGREVADSDSGSEIPCYSGTETGDARVGK